MPCSVQVLLCAGMLSAALVDWGLSSLPGAWRWMVAMPLAPALLMSGRTSLFHSAATVRSPLQTWHALLAKAQAHCLTHFLCCLKTA